MILVTKVAGSWVVEITGADLGMAMSKAVYDGNNISMLILHAVQTAIRTDIPEDIDN